MELLVFGHAGAKVLVFPTREGRFYEFENWGMVEALRHPVDCGNIRMFCVDAVDSESLYCESVPPPARVERHRRYERYILREVIPLMLAENGVPSLIAHGCSIGAYDAASLALRYPSLFCKVVALTGRYDQEVYFITPNHFLPNLGDPTMSNPCAVWKSRWLWVSTTLFMRATAH
jgi:esterase/lipase superfamily enzyme